MTASSFSAESIADNTTGILSWSTYHDLDIREVSVLFSLLTTFYLLLTLFSPQYKFKDNIVPQEAIAHISVVTDVAGDGNCGF